MITETRIPIYACRRGYYLRWYYNGWHYWNFYSGTLNLLTQGEKYRTTGIRKADLNSGPVSASQIEAIRSILNAKEAYLYTDGGFAEVRIDGGDVVVSRNEVNAYECELTIAIGSRKVSATGYSIGKTIPVEVPVVPTPGDICEVVIDTQTWLCKNWNAGYTGSKVLENNEANRAIYGGLYTWAQIHEPGFVPAGWHLPTFTEITALIAILDNSYSGIGIEGGVLKEAGTSHWNSPNTGATDGALFTARPGGRAYLLHPSYNDSNVYFTGKGQSFYMWYDEPYSGGEGYILRLNHDSAGYFLGFIHQANVQAWYCSVRFIKD